MPVTALISLALEAAVVAALYYLSNSAVGWKRKLLFVGLYPVYIPELRSCLG